MTTANPAIKLDAYIVDVLMRDLAGHDRTPAAFLVFLLLWRRTREARTPTSVRLSHQQIADDTGLSKSAVQQALRILHRRGLVKSKRRHRTDIPEHSTHRPWMKNDPPTRSKD
jgi:DNA-binding GntR family transcriptional regulator